MRHRDLFHTIIPKVSLCNLSYGCRGTARWQWGAELCLPSNPSTQATPTSTALQPTKTPTSHHSSRCLLIGPRSPRVRLEVSVNRIELTIRLLKTTRIKRAGEGMRVSGEDSVTVMRSRAGRVVVLDAVRFLGDMVADLNCDNTAIQKLTLN